MTDRVRLILDSGLFASGPCAFCEGAMARHRLIDAVIDSEDTVEDAAEDFDLPVEIVEAVRDLTEEEYDELCTEGTDD